MTDSIVIVRWRDAWSTNEWANPNELDSTEVIVKSVGFLLPEYKPGYVVVVQSDDGQNELSNYLFIPVGMVEQIQVVSVMREGNDAPA